MATWAVLVMEMGRYQDEEGESMVGGFASFERAREYARRRTRDSLEGLRKTGQTAEELRQLWLLYGEDAMVIGAPSYKGFAELDFFIAHPASREECDWRALAPG